ncbi:MAG: hypothetical protein EBU33_07545 [Sphingobacteriia bacterium]|nr:hypothetical protein [Sphingobacteriia bacterium]
MVFDPFKIELPVRETIPALRQYLQDGNTVLLSAPPGAGKSTLLPLALLEESWLSGKKIILLEPRRLAARGVAMRMAELLGEELPTHIKRLGMRDHFGESGKPEELFESFGLTAKHIALAAHEISSNKKARS